MLSQMPTTQELIVTLERCVFDSPGDRPFSVWLVAPAGGGEAFRARADLPGDRWGATGDRVRLLGKWVDDPRYGRQFVVLSVLPDIPDGGTAMVRWLAEQPGIGQVTAAKVVGALGDTPDALLRVCEDPTVLDCIGLTGARRDAVVAAAFRYQEERGRNDVLRWCFRVGLGPAMAERVYERWKERSIPVLSENPWALTAVQGIGFLTADEAAQRLGVDPASESRMRAALVYVLDVAASDEGHVYLPREEWIERADEVLRQTAERSGYGQGREGTIRRVLIQTAAKMLEDSSGPHGHKASVIASGTQVYRRDLWDAERTVARWLWQCRRAKPRMDVGAATKLALDPSIRGNLDEVQTGAVIMALTRGVSVLTGGPGTGKSTTTRAVVEAFRRIQGEQFAPMLCAPTGRAAKRLGEVTGIEARTIHRLLEYHPQVGFRRNATRPLEGSLLIADEMSMADLTVFAALIDALPDGVPVLLVGDADQLPPVGPGSPFHEIVQKNLLPITRLERIYRQDEGGPIALAARSINEGSVPPLEDDPQGRYRVRVFPRMKSGEGAGREEMAEAVVGAVRSLLMEGWRAEDIQVLTPIKRGPLGTHALNARLRPLLNSGVKDPETDIFRTAGGREIWLGDRVVQTVNDYDLGVFNGEIGKVVAVNVPVDGAGKDSALGILVEFEEGDGTKTIPYWAGNIGNLQLAYAATVHKAQGSEFPAVIFALAWDAYLLLTRPLVYTGVSRARELLWLLMEDGALRKAVATVRDVERYQNIAEMW